MTESRYTQQLVPSGSWRDCCNECGALIGDRQQHDAWHDRVMEDPLIPTSGEVSHEP